VIKTLCRTEQNSNEANTPDAKVGHLELVSFTRQYFDDALEYVKSRAVISRASKQDGKITVCTTGLGCTGLGRTISDTLNVNLKNEREFDCFVKAFQYLVQHTPRADLFEPFLVEATTEASLQERFGTVYHCMDESITANKHVDPSSATGLVINTSTLPVGES
jgi:pantothenate kinase